jgi:glycosyltransferase involved in cell wall biosynthesis
VSSPSPQSPAPSPYSVLFVGSLFNRRHVIDLIRAFAPIARLHPDASLDIVGDDRSFPREDLRAAIVAEQLEEHVRWHAYVTEEQLAALYAGARAFAFLSEYEGLGLTPLEALAAGIPPVLLDTDVARESCGNAAVYGPRAICRRRRARSNRCCLMKPPAGESWRRRRRRWRNTAGRGPHGRH